MTYRAAAIAARPLEHWHDVEADAARVNDPTTLERLRNVVERAIVAAHVRGPRVLDAGIGTGRIGLALRGITLTGLDWSPAMLDRCRAAAGTAVTLVKGELAALPFAAASFESALSIDAFALHDAWATHLDELLRVVVPGGRVIVDVGAADHRTAVVAARAEAVPPAPGLSLSLDEIAAFAQARGAGVRAVVPYGAALGPPAANAWLRDRRGADDRVERLLSWLGADDALFACAVFLERRIVGALAPRFGARMVVVLERDAPDRNDGLARVRAFEAASAAGEVTLDAFAREHDAGPAAFFAELAQHAAAPRSRAFACALLACAAESTRLPAPLVASFPPQLAQAWSDCARTASAPARAAAAAAAIRATLGDESIFHGVDLRPALARAAAGAVSARARQA